MKRLLALLLAAAMMLTLSVGALAEDEGIEELSEVPIRVGGMAPGQPVVQDNSGTNTNFLGYYYVNKEENVTFFEYLADYPITSIQFKNSILSNYYNVDTSLNFYRELDLGRTVLKGKCDDSKIYISVSLPNPYEDICNDSFYIQDTMSVLLTNGKKYDFPVVLRSFGVVKKILLEVTDEDGIDISKYEGVMGKNGYPIPVDGSMKFTVSVLDAAKISTPPYHIRVSMDDNGFYANDFIIGETTFTDNGTKGHFSITNSKNNSVFHTGAYSYLTIDLWDDSVDGNEDTRTSYKFTVATDYKDNPDNPDPDNPDNPDNPDPDKPDPDKPDKPDPDKPDRPDPDKPDKPDKPTPPAKDPDKTPAAPEATDNKANDDKTIADLASGEDTTVKLSNGSAGLSAETINALGGHGSRLTLQNGGMSVTFPNGFNKVTEAGRIYYPFDYEDAPVYANAMLSGVKGVGVKSGARKVGGSMTLPGTANVTLKTKLEGPVNIYLYDHETGSYSVVGTATAKDGTVTFPTNKMGYMVLTTGRI